MPAAALRAVLTDPNTRVDPHGIQIRGVKFDDPLDLNYVIFAHPLHLLECVLEQGLNARYAQIRGLTLAQVTVNGGVHALGVTIGGQLILKGVILSNPNGSALLLDHARITGDVLAGNEFNANGVVRALDATVGGELDLTGATLDNQNDYALLLDGAQITGNVFAGNGFRANGKVRAAAARIGGALSLRGATLENPDGVALNLDTAQITGSVHASEGGLADGQIRAFHANGEVRALGATIGGQLDLTGATLDNQNGDALSLDGAQITGGVFAGVRPSADGQIRAFHANGKIRALGATIGGQLDLSGATLDNQNGDALSLDGAQITRDVFAGDGFRANGKVSALGATVGGQLDLTGATLDNQHGDALSLDGAQITGNVFAGVGPSADGQIRAFRANGKIRALGATIGGQLDLRGATLNNPSGVALLLDDARITSDVYAGDKFEANGGVSANGASVGGQLDLTGATLDNQNGDALSLDGAQITGNVFAGNGFRANGKVRARGATIGVDLVLNGATLEKPDGVALHLDGAHIAGNVFAGVRPSVDGQIRAFRANGEVRAFGASIDGQLDLSGATLNNPATLDNPDRVALVLETLTVSRLVLTPEKCCGSVNLIRAQVGDLLVAECPPEPLLATGWTVGDLHGPLREHWRLAHRWLDTASADTGSSGLRAWWRRHTAWLRPNKPPVPVQPWYALAEVYDRNGDPAAARRLRFAAANKVTAQSPPLTRIVRAVYCVVAGNGYYPLLSIASMVVLLAISAAMVHMNRDDILPTNPTAARLAAVQHLGDQAAKPWLPITAQTPCEVHPGYPCMQPLTFAINTVLPPAAGKNADWMIAPNASLLLVIGLPIVKLALWALAALFLAGVTGLLRLTAT